MSITIKERGWAGHFIAADGCRYRRNTLVSDGTRHVVVSSVGAYFYKGKIETIGLDRYYETMAFVGSRQGPYIDSDGREITLGTDVRGIYGKSPKDLPDDVDNRADEIHERNVAWVVKNWREVWKEQSRPVTDREKEGGR